MHYPPTNHFLHAVDCIIFGFDGFQLKLLLVHRDIDPEKGKWSLMGGFVQANESLDEAAYRVLQGWTGIQEVYLEQVQTFGQVQRDPIERVISTAYYALINLQDYDPHLLVDHNAEWFPVDQAPPLIFDHGHMVQAARHRLQEKAAIQPIGFALLPPQFTLQQLQRLYETISGISLDKRNFTRRIHGLGILRQLDEKEKSSSKKGAFLYEFDEKAYQLLLSEGVNFVIK